MPVEAEADGAVMHASIAISGKCDDRHEGKHTNVKVMTACNKVGFTESHKIGPEALTTSSWLDPAEPSVPESNCGCRGNSDVTPFAMHLTS
jgi:hypothetical protein